jgi:hypothetical protein
MYDAKPREGDYPSLRCKFAYVVDVACEEAAAPQGAFIARTVFESTMAMGDHDWLYHHATES